MHSGGDVNWEPSVSRLKFNVADDRDHQNPRHTKQIVSIQTVLSPNRSGLSFSVKDPLVEDSWKIRTRTSLYQLAGKSSVL